MSIMGVEIHKPGIYELAAILFLPFIIFAVLASAIANKLVDPNIGVVLAFGAMTTIVAYVFRLNILRNGLPEKIIALLFGFGLYETTSFVSLSTLRVLSRLIV